MPSGNAPALCACRRELPSAPREPQGRGALARDGWCTDTRLGVATTLARAFAAMCVQLVDASYNLAIHMLTRGWLRSSSTHEPSDPPLEVVFVFGFWLGAACLICWSSAAVQGALGTQVLKVGFGGAPRRAPRGDRLDANRPARASGGAEGLGEGEPPPRRSPLPPRPLSRVASGAGLERERRRFPGMSECA